MKQKNVFKDVKFGDKFTTKGGCLAVYVESDMTQTHTLLVNIGITPIFVPFSENGKCCWQNSAQYNIVAKAEEPKDMILKACKAYCDNICERGMVGMCYHKHDNKGQMLNDFEYNECETLKLLRNEMGDRK